MHNTCGLNVAVVYYLSLMGDLPGDYPAKQHSHPNENILCLVPNCRNIEAT